ncbi:MAG: ribbon-helix-helix protein, CopG family [Myxococcota bacterium]|nr:ribbon-helix-helix protein, CopG family [Myxococcota bacterium]
MKTAISIPDDIFQEAERYARRTNKSRSQLFREALIEYLARHDSERITTAMDKMCEKVDTHPDPVFDAAARRVLEQSEW